MTLQNTTTSSTAHSASHPAPRAPSQPARRGSGLRASALALGCAAALALAGCASNPTNAQVGTGVGAVLGGTAGHVIFGGPVGTIGGAAAGALIGNEVGKDRDRNQRRR